MLSSHLSYKIAWLALLLALGGGAARAQPLPDTIAIEEVSIAASQRKRSLVEVIDIGTLQAVTGAASNFETILKVLPGVQSGSELSSQYSVRGGSYDENLVYVNGVEVFRPMLTRTGQQEGLSIINPQMVGRAEFSTGGFGAEYGGKMASVLNVQYKRPLSNGGSVDAGLLGASAAGQFISTSRRASGIIGLRHRRTDYLLNTLDDAGDYKPIFYDAQALFHFDIAPQWTMHLFGTYALNRYDFRPSNRYTTFSTLVPINFMTYNEGSESDRYSNSTAALSIDYAPHRSVALNLTLSGAWLKEEESLDILSQYLLTWASNAQNRSDYDIGSLRQHARNTLGTQIWQASHKGSWANSIGTLQWGAQAQMYRISDDAYWWQTLDSAGYMYPRGEHLAMRQFVQAVQSFTNHKYAAYAQQSFDIALGSQSILQLSAGIRLDYSAASGELLAAPRLQATFHPKHDKRLSVHTSLGLYYQPPFYKELRSAAVLLYTRRSAQRSLQAAAGIESIVLLGGIPCRFTAEAYYKMLHNLIPYTRDNVSIVYYPQSTADGYTYGIDTRLSGELTTGVESWLSISLMQARQDITGDAYGTLPLPSDQRFNASLMLQDRVPHNPHWQAYVLFHYGSAIPAYTPYGSGLERYTTMPAYSRADLGLSYVFWDQALPRTQWRYVNADFIRSLSLTLEVMNVFDVRNVSSYLWIPTIVGDALQMAAVSNYLTPRLINVSVKITF